MFPQIVLQDENSLQTVEEHSKTTDFKGKAEKLRTLLII